MNIVIRNYLSGSFQLEREPNDWDAIVILDSGISPTDFVPQHTRRHIYLQFDDITFNAPGKRIATSDDIRSALAFATQSQQLMVCCRAGQSRSAAIGFLICHQHVGYDAATKLLNPTRHLPNPLIIDLGSRLIDDPTVSQTFAEWRGANSHVKLTKYLDDIEREFEDLERQGARNRIVAGSAT